MNNSYEPSYISLFENGELEKRVELAISKLKSCVLCPRNCKVNRLENEKGFCRVGRTASISSHNIHFGEEPPITGTKGSGTIFFSNCNLKCKFCQNYPISQLGVGGKTPANVLGKMMLTLQEKGAHNINLVTPSHVVPQFLEGLFFAVESGLKIPIVWNSNGYDGIESLKLLDGIVDIYMPDIKYIDNNSAIYCSNAPDYFKYASIATKEMFKQVGILKTDEREVGIHGMLIRHLVLPNNLASSEIVFEFIATELSTKIPVNIMSQYFPAWKAKDDKTLNRRITNEEYQNALDALHKWKLVEGWSQEMPNE